MRKLRRWIGAVVILMVILLAGFAYGAYHVHGAMAAHKSSAAAQSPGCNTSRWKWSIATTPDPGNGTDTLTGVAAISPSDAWAVGYDIQNNPSAHQTLVEHWDGTTWTVVPSPSPGVQDNRLYAISADSANDIWAVGFSMDAYVTRSTLIEHWNGTSWDIVPSPGSSGIEIVLTGVVALSPTNAWAVGYISTGYHQTLIEHWDGTKWSIVSSPNASAQDNYLESVSAVSSTDIWAVGYAQSSHMAPLTEHWDGASWTIFASPTVSTEDTFLKSVAAGASDDVWAVGSASGTDGTAILLHWNGTSWSLTSTPPTVPFLNAVTVIAPNDIWAVGGTLPPYSRAVAEWFDGTTWHVEFAANVGINDNVLRGVVGITPAEILTVGYDSADSGDLGTQTLAERGFPMAQAMPRSGVRSPGAAIPCA